MGVILRSISVRFINVGATKRSHLQEQTGSLRAPRKSIAEIELDYEVR